MSSSEDDFAWDETNDKNGGRISGGFTKRTSRRGKTPNYLESKDEDEAAESDDSEVQIVNPINKKSSPKKKASPKVTKSVLESLSDSDVNEEDTKPAAVEAAADAKINASASEGINLLIPHSLLNKHQGAGKGECTMLVQVDGDDHQLDFHGQSGAVGRFEADERGVTLDLKGFQYRGTIRPGPTAMVIALTRDNQFKVEAITDEFVTLDTERTNMMDKFDAIVEGEMDDSYKVTDDNVNRKQSGKEDEEKEDGGKNGTKRKSGNNVKLAGGAAKKRKVT